MACGIPKAYMFDITMYKLRFIPSCIKNIYTKENRSAMHWNVQPNVCFNGAVEFRSNGLRHAPMSVTVSITPVCWQLRFSVLLLSL